MYKFAVSVRAYTVGIKRGYDLNTASGCIAAADDLVKHPYSAVGKRTIIELYRAGGLGVYQIAKLTGKNPDDVKKLCAIFDYRLHDFY